MTNYDNKLGLNFPNISENGSQFRRKKFICYNFHITNFLCYLRDSFLFLISLMHYFFIILDRKIVLLKKSIEGIGSNEGKGN